VNHKWHSKINKFNVKTAAHSLPGLQKNKSSISKKGLTLLFDVKIVVQKHVQTSTTVVGMVAAVAVDHVNLSRSLVLTAVQKILFHLSQEATDQYFAVTVSEKVKTANFSL
jgi:hypothetical protein